MDSTIHEHCENCFKLYCNVYSSCKMVHCEFGCPVLMHSCKMADHKTICQKMKVCCLNADYGCPAMMPRENLKIHLEICPASVTCCTMEWNRYPIYSKSRLSWVPFFQPNPILVKGQLDVELTLRDQRVLKDLLRKRMKKGKVNVDKIRLNAERAASSRARRTKKRESESEREDYGIAMALALSALEEKIRVKKLNYKVTAESLLPSDTSGNQRSLSEENQLEGSVKDFSNLSNEETRLENLLVECNSEKAIELHGSESVPAISENSNFFGQPVNQSLPQNNLGIPVPPELAPRCFDQNLGLNVMIETLPKFQKQFPMYAIPCNQVFRRNEFGSHFKNVHSDIQGGLNGWLEHRCPLAHYGCTFVRYRILPHSQDGTVVFNQDLGSFGVQLNKHCESNSVQPMNSEIHENGSSGNLAEKDLLTTLPVEVLEHIANMLDGFSLCSFSCTCKALREASRHVLETKGMVVLEWEKKVYRTGHWRWRVRQKVCL